MTPLLASLLEALEDQPSSVSGTVISSTAAAAISHIRRLEAALERISQPIDFKNRTPFTDLEYTQCVVAGLRAEAKRALSSK